MTGMLGEVSGATLKRGVYFGRSRSRFQRTRMSLNSNVAVKRPHMLAKSSVVFMVGQGRLSIQGDASFAKAWVLRQKVNFPNWSNCTGCHAQDKTRQQQDWSGIG